MGLVQSPSSLQQTSRAAAPIALLLLEPQFLLRSTLASVAREMRLADPVQATGVEAAARLLESRSFDALLLSLDEDGAALDLMKRVREGETRCGRATPIAVTAGACDTALVMRLKQLEVRRLLLRPFKVKGVLEAIAALRQPDSPPHAAAARAA